MAIQTKITQPGNGQTSTLGGQLRLDDGNNRMVGVEGEDTRMLIGVHPDGSWNITISSDGEDVFSLL